MDIIVCPKCFDGWAIPKEEKPPRKCECFKCGHRYFPRKMYDFVYEAMKRTHG